MSCQCKFNHLGYLQILSFAYHSFGISQPSPKKWCFFNFNWCLHNFVCYKGHWFMVQLVSYLSLIAQFYNWTWKWIVLRIPWNLDYLSWLIDSICMALSSFREVVFSVWFLFQKFGLDIMFKFEVAFYHFTIWLKMQHRF